ncbi:ABC transporter ATP-binding protein [Ferrimonas sp. SCSIO 43195]|uniref:ABC transporter ATP-binding protein n=1 Tax=Ferrimonas sp. SCSIO 43195 TaxID=2822844 RepID=UPI002075E509|nr:ABC transporter ATP-binding protein [Ferrimonas sp. SCSIO 43195]USD36532.1 ABC transporter ATP-binding protein [Ferrimonas sp. SCSIO 43195]
MITLTGIHKAFRTHDIETVALDALDLTVAPGDFVSIMGPSGCGKSTLLSIIGMLDHPDAGQYRFDGEQIEGFSERQLASLRSRSLGYIFQSFNLVDDLTVAQNVELPLLYNKVAKAERRQRVAAILDQLNIGHRAGHLPQQLSGGQQQRVAIARALVINPKLILADEPTGNLDSENGLEVMRLLTELNRKGTTIVMVTHSRRDADYGNRIIELLDGKVVDGDQGQPLKEVQCA